MRALVPALLVALVAPASAWASDARVVSEDVPLRRGPAAERPPIRFNLVGLHWQGAGTVRFRTRPVDGDWGRWHSAAPEAEGPDRASVEEVRSRGWNVSDAYWTGTADRIEYRRAGPVRRLRAYFVWSPVLAVPLRSVSIASSPRILPRAAWQADERIRRAPPEYAPAVRFAVVHHTAGSNAYSRAESAAIVRAIELYHVRGNGWNDIGYNFLVDKYGQIFEGRYGGVSRPVIGAHAQGFNTGSVGVSLLGTYASTAPSQAALTALEKLLAWRLDLAHVDPLSFLSVSSLGNPRFPAGRPVLLRTISGHRDTNFTDCPGNALYARIPAIARGVSRLGLPKLYAPSVRGSLGGGVRFAARLSNRSPWSVSVRDPTGGTVAGGSGIGTKVAWTWDSAPAPRQRYAWSIDAPSVRPARGSLGPRAPQPPLALLSEVSASPATVTPNDDGRGDFTTIRYRLAADALVTVTFVDEAAGTTVATLFSESRPAGRHAFRFSAATLPDGHYLVVITVQAADGRTATASAQLLVSRLLRSFGVRPAAFSPNGDGRFDRLAFSFELAASASVRLEARRRGVAAGTIHDSELGAGRHRLTWDGTTPAGRVADGRYSALLSVSDASAAVSLTTPFTVDTKPPRLSVVSRFPLRVRVGEPATLTVLSRGRRSTLRVRAGIVVLERALRGARIIAEDDAGNRTKALRLP